jgi:hypothetical protein
LQKNINVASRNLRLGKYSKNNLIFKIRFQEIVFLLQS